MSEFDAREIRAFLESVNRHLSSPAILILIGGGAASLAYSAESTTNDLDAWNALSQELQRALDLARHATGLNVPVATAGIATPPLDSEDRLKRVLPGLVTLEVLALEKHDLAWSKVVRWSESDQRHVAEIHQAVGLDFDTLTKRFRDEMYGLVPGDSRRLRDHFLWMVENLFGELKRIAAEKLVPVTPASDRV